jgi:hypothetical protein
VIVVGPKTGERWESAAPGLNGLTVELSADGETALISDPDGDVCTLPRAAWVPVADALLALHVAAARR